MAGAPPDDRTPSVSGQVRRRGDGEPGELGEGRPAGLRHREAHGDPPHRGTAIRSDSATVPFPFQIQVSHQTQERSAKFLPTASGIQQGAAWRMRAHPPVPPRCLTTGRRARPPDGLLSPASPWQTPHSIGSAAGPARGAGPYRITDAHVAEFRTAYPADADLVQLLAWGASTAVDRFEAWITAGSRTAATPDDAAS